MFPYPAEKQKQSMSSFCGHGTYMSVSVLYSLRLLIFSGIYPGSLIYK